MTPWTAARQASLSITNSRSLLKLMSIESVMPSKHLILCCPLLLLPSILPSIRVFSNESALRMKWPKYWSFSFSISPSNEHPGLISFRMDWLDLLAVQRTLKSLLQHHSSKASIFWRSALFMVQLSHPYRTNWKNHSFDCRDLGWQSDVSAFFRLNSHGDKETGGCYLSSCSQRSGSPDPKKNSWVVKQARGLLSCSKDLYIGIKAMGQDLQIKVFERKCSR